MGNYDLYIILITQEGEHGVAIKGHAYKQRPEAIKWAIDSFLELANEHNEKFAKESTLPEDKKTVDYMDTEIVEIKVYELPLKFREELI